MIKHSFHCLLACLLFRIKSFRSLRTISHCIAIYIFYHVWSRNTVMVRVIKMNKNVHRKYVNISLYLPTALFIKYGSNHIKGTMKIVKEALSERQFKFKWVLKNGSFYELVTHNSVRCLSRGRVCHIFVERPNKRNIYIRSTFSLWMFLTDFCRHWTETKRFAHANAVFFKYLHSIWKETQAHQWDSIRLILADILIR